MSSSKQSDYNASQPIDNSGQTDTTQHNQIISASSPEDPPIYEKEGLDLVTQIRELAAVAHADKEAGKTFYGGDDVPYRSFHHLGSGDYCLRRYNVIDSYFDAIRTKKDEVVAAYIESGLVTTETISRDHRTPLVAAVEAGNIRTVQQLMDFDADVNAFGAVAGSPEALGKLDDRVMRTPLMVAAATGNLTIVKLLMETYGADDSLIAPDGQLALRLAASNGHREIVDYLPTRRGGGFRRWKHKHQKAMRRAKKAAVRIYKIGKFFVFDIPKFWLWTLPEHVVFGPLYNFSKWLWEHGDELPHLFVNWVVKMQAKAKRGLEELWKLLKKTPKALKILAEHILKFIKAIPKAVKAMLLRIWLGIKTASNAVLDILKRFVSFLHTTLVAVMSFFRDITLRDVWNGLVSFLKAIAEAPQKIWKWVTDLENPIIVILVFFFWYVPTHIPKLIGKILAACGTSIANACHEVLVWIDPKRQ